MSLHDQCTPPHANNRHWYLQCLYSKLDSICRVSVVLELVHIFPGVIVVQIFLVDIDDYCPKYFGLKVEAEMKNTHKLVIE